jgi:hypothetical protein
LIKIFPEDQHIVPELFSKIWHELSVTSLKKVEKIIERLKFKLRQDLVSLIISSQEHIIIDDCADIKDKIDYINKHFDHIKYIDIDIKIKYDINIFGDPKVRNVKIHKTTFGMWTEEKIISRFVEHIEKWKGCVRIEYFRDIENHEVILHYDNGYISFNGPYFTIEQLSKLRPEGYIPLNSTCQRDFPFRNSKSYSHLNLYYALCIPTIDRIKFISIPRPSLPSYHINLVHDILVPSCQIPDIIPDHFLMMENLNIIQDRKYKVHHSEIDTKKSRIKHILFDDKDILNSQIQDGTDKFLRAPNMRIMFPNLVSMRIPIDNTGEHNMLENWNKIAPNVKKYVSCPTVMIKYYKETERLLKKSFDNFYTLRHDMILL